MKLITTLTNPGVTLDIYCHCRRKCKIQDRLLEGTRIATCRKHGQMATVTQES